LYIWGFLALCRIAAAILLPSVKSFLIPEPWNTVLFFAIGAVLIGVNGRNWWQRRGLAYKGRAISRPSDLLELSPAEFEEMVAEVYRAKGHRARRTGTVGDHGVDIVVEAKNGEKWVVQCKRWRGTVGERVVREFYGTMLHEKADKGAIVTTGFFTPQAREWAKGKPVFLYNGEEFLRIWQQLERTRAKRGAAVTSSEAASPAKVPDSSFPSEPPRCPRCGVPMVLRVARRGNQPGRVFYGCPNYPLCREMINIPTGREQ
jgi:restriction system protein